MTNAQVRAREYQRVSFDRSGRERSPEEQHLDHEDAAASRGWVLHAEPYRDLGSASRYARKDRAGFERLLTDLESDTFGADVLVLWEGSRGSRKVSEWLRLVEACEAAEVLLYVHVQRRVYDPTVPHDRADLLRNAVGDELSSAETSMRITRNLRVSANDGRAHGRAPFGYRREYWYETINGRQVRQWKQVADEDTAPLVRELFERIEGGHSLRSIAVDWGRRGIVNRSGRPFTGTHLRSMATNPSYSGQRVYDPARKGQRLSEDAAYIKADFPALVQRARFLAVQRILTDPSRVVTRPGRARHFLTMLGTCDPCGSPLTARNHRGEAMYRCRDAGHVSVNEAELDKLAEGYLLGYLARPDVFDELTAGEQAADAELATADDAVALVRQELDELAAEVGSGRLSATLAARAEPAILARLREAEARVKALRRPSILSGLIEPGSDVARRWADAPMEVRRSVARLLFVPELLGELRVIRAPRSGRVPVSERVKWRGID